ncbi:hypothetical protein [Ferrimonas pelagia]|uniref:DUF1579 domain-containing protein n=1 Tax=Ferrimonas pelagia TaxID=1177826 RepID=A0ABP9EJQ2_9GAMM
MIRLWLWCVLCLFPATLRAELAPPFAPFAPYVGKTWRGELTVADRDEPMVDISTWEMALQDQAVRIRHTLDDGVYEGETFIVWNKEREMLEFFYFTTAGFYTRGTVKFAGRNFTSYEDVTGSEEGITQVRAEIILEGDDVMHQQAYYLKQGEWVKGHSATYRAISP